MIQKCTSLEAEYEFVTEQHNTGTYLLTAQHWHNCLTVVNTLVQFMFALSLKNIRTIAKKYLSLLTLALCEQ